MLPLNAAERIRYNMGCWACYHDSVKPIKKEKKVGYGAILRAHFTNEAKRLKGIARRNKEHLLSKHS
jgi:hypothetical protein